LAQRGAHLAKADLSTAMVGEFPELQGIMGRYYALNDGEDPRVADAIAEHYKPLGPSDTSRPRRSASSSRSLTRSTRLLGFSAPARSPLDRGIRLACGVPLSA